MLSTFEVFLNSFLVFLLPLAVRSLVTGELPPETTWMGRLYRTDRHLMLFSNLFLLTLCASAAVRLSHHFSLLDDAVTARAEALLMIPFLALLVVFCAMLIRALLRLWRQNPERTARGS